MSNYLGEFQIIISKENKSRTRIRVPIPNKKNLYEITNYIECPEDANKLLLQLKIDENKLSIEKFDKFIKENSDNFYIKSDDDDNSLIRFRTQLDISSGIRTYNKEVYNYELHLEEILTIDLPEAKYGESNLPDEYELILFEDVLLHECLELRECSLDDF